MENISQLSTIKHALTLKQHNSQLCLQIIENYKQEMLTIKNITQHLRE